MVEDIMGLHASITICKLKVGNMLLMQFIKKELLSFCKSFMQEELLIHQKLITCNLKLHLPSKTKIRKVIKPIQISPYLKKWPYKILRRLKNSFKMLWLGQKKQALMVLNYMKRKKDKTIKLVKYAIFPIIDWIICHKICLPFLLIFSSMLFIIF